MVLVIASKRSSTNLTTPHVDGALAMANRSQDPSSAGSQFYFCLGPQHGLDSGYTVFGTTIEGMDVISQLRLAISSIPLELKTLKASRTDSWRGYC